jgi:sulfur-oxidizing protein SoxA
MSRHFSSVFLRLIVPVLAMSHPLLGVAQIIAQSPAEVERIGLIKVLQQKYPGTGPADWSFGAEALSSARGATPVAIPFNPDNATNSADILAIGKKQWDRKFKDGKSFTHCFPNGGKRVASTYPQYDPKAKLVVTLEMALNRCLQLHGEAEIAGASAAAMGPLVAYFRSLAEGQKLAVRVTGSAAMDKFISGKSLFQRRIGQQDHACASCHVRYAGSSYGNGGLSPAVGQAVSWPRIEPGGTVRTLQMQYRMCMKRSGAEPFDLGSDELNNLEYYHAYLSNGLGLSRLLPVQTLRN